MIFAKEVPRGQGKNLILCRKIDLQHLLEIFKVF
jgi:hypothetical protein